MTQHRNDNVTDGAARPATYTGLAGIVLFLVPVFALGGWLAVLCSILSTLSLGLAVVAYDAWVVQRQRDEIEARRQEWADQ